MPAPVLVRAPAVAALAPEIVRAPVVTSMVPVVAAVSVKSRAVEALAPVNWRVPPLNTRLAAAVVAAPRLSMELIARVPLVRVVTPV